MAYETFRAKVPILMGRLIMAEFGFSVEDAAAIAGNAGHESMGFTKLQEMKPTMKGSRGGYGWFQWTGPRRRAFEKWCRDQGIVPSSDAANIGYIIQELRTTEARAVPAIKAAQTLADKVVAFEKAYERAGVKHYPSRLNYAQIARDAYYKTRTDPTEPPKVEPVIEDDGSYPEIPDTSPEPTGPGKWLTALFGGGGMGLFGGYGYGLPPIIILAAIGLTAFAVVTFFIVIGRDRRERLWEKMAAKVMGWFS